MKSGSERKQENNTNHPPEVILPVFSVADIAAVIVTGVRPAREIATFLLFLAIEPS
jgi:hypothetical protein